MNKGIILTLSKFIISVVLFACFIIYIIPMSKFISNQDFLKWKEFLGLTYFNNARYLFYKKEIISLGSSFLLYIFFCFILGMIIIYCKEGLKKGQFIIVLKLILIEILLLIGAIVLNYNVFYRILGHKNPLVSLNSFLSGLFFIYSLRVLIAPFYGFYLIKEKNFKEAWMQSKNNSKKKRVLIIFIYFIIFASLIFLINPIILNTINFIKLYQYLYLNLPYPILIFILFSVLAQIRNKS